MSQLSQDFEDQPIFSTPVRASFRDRLRPRPHTAIHLGDAKPPSKREGKTRLREIKTKGRRWSAVVAENGGNNFVDIRDDIPQGLEPSLVAVWSQFLGYEPSNIPALSSVVTPSMK